MSAVLCYPSAVQGYVSKPMLIFVDKLLTHVDNYFPILHSINCHLLRLTKLFMKCKPQDKIPVLAFLCLLSGKNLVI